MLLFEFVLRLLSGCAAAVLFLDLHIEGRLCRWLMCAGEQPHCMLSSVVRFGDRGRENDVHAV